MMTVSLMSWENAMGECTCNLKCHYKGHKHRLNFKIVDARQPPLLSSQTCTQMGLISVHIDDAVNSVEQHDAVKALSEQDLVHEFKDVFEGLGCLAGDYHIEIDPTVRPVQNAPRRVPVPMKDKLYDKICELEKRRTIAKVTEPTAWISSLVVVDKPGKMRICLDPRELNKAIKRPKYQMPTLDEIFADTR